MVLDGPDKENQDTNVKQCKTNVHTLKVLSTFCSYIKCNCSYKSNTAGCCKPADVWNKCGSVDLIHCPKQSNFSLSAYHGFYSVFIPEWVLPTTLDSVIQRGIYLVVSTKVGT